MATLENTRQWTRLAGMGKLSQAHVERAGEIDPHDATGPTQYVVLAIRMAEAVQNGMPISMSTLAEDILAGQAKRVKQYRKDAYPLSEKQVNVILSEVNRWQVQPQTQQPQTQTSRFCPMCGFEGKHHPSCEVYS